MATRGVNLAGYYGVPTSGLSEVRRLLALALDRAGVPWTSVPYDEAALARGESPLERVDGPLYDTNVVCLNPLQFRTFAHGAGPELFANAYTVAFWWWELSQFPEELQAGVGIVDEVWAGSDFARDAIAATTTKPVLTMPLPVEVPRVRERSRTELGLPEGFLFLFVFDFFSIFERKNPLAAVDAFKRAFRDGDGASLVVKSVNGAKRPAQLERLRQASAGRTDVHVVDGYVPTEDKDALIAACDCYVSLHRSEGFGLTMAEAMALGKPVIATRYSGNLTFMSDENSYLVGWSPSRVPAGCDPYPAGAEWAEPDVDEAAELMRRVYDDRAGAAAVASRAREDVLRRHSLERTSEWLASRLDTIDRSSARRSPELVAVDRAIRRAFADASRGPRSTRRLGRVLDHARSTALRALGSRTTAVSVTAALRELLLVQQQQAKELEELRRRLDELERE